jgi:hypothetical protein
MAAFVFSTNVHAAVITVAELNEKTSKSQATSKI